MSCESCNLLTLLLCYSFALVLNSVFPFLETLGLRVPDRYSKDFALVNASHVKTVPLLDVIHLLMLFVGTLTHLESKLFRLVLFYNVTFLIIKILTVLIINQCIHFFSYCVMIGVTAFLEFLEFPKRYKLASFVYCWVSRSCAIYNWPVGYCGST